MMRKLQANISGFDGRPVSVLAALDEDSGILVVAASVEAHERRPGSFMISDDPRADRDMPFGIERLGDALAAYSALRRRPAPDGQGNCLRFGQRALNADPANAIEADGMDVSGPRYRLLPDIDNAKVATLSLCLYAVRQPLIDEVVDFSDALNRLLHGQVVTL